MMSLKRNLHRLLTPQVRALLTAAFLLATVPGVNALDLGLPGGGSGSCDPTKMSCAPGGGGGGGSGICKLFPDLPECKPGGGGGGGGGGGTCTVPPGGSPSCGGSGPASTGGGGSGGVSVGGGNPINLISGNKYQEETDLAALPGMLGLELKRYYNSLSSHPGIAGPQWRLSYETVLYDLGSQIQILQADGRRLSFAKPQATALAKGAGNGLCTSPQLSDGQVRIERQPDGQPVYHWRWADGRTLTFMGGSGNGFPLHRISAPTGEQVQLRYNPLGDLVGVTDPQGRTLSFLYGRAGPGQRAPLEGVDTPLGRIRYAHDKLGRLTEAAFLPRQSDGKGVGAASLTRLYHYEEAHQAGNTFALTGISLRTPGDKGQPQTQRLSTYAYEAGGAAILTTRGSPQARDAKGQVVPGTGIEQLQVRYETRALPQEGAPDRSGEVQPKHFGRIVLTNALGQTTVMRSAVIAGQLRLIDSRGAGCSTCGPANTSYGYDREGRLIRTTQLSAEGQPLRSELRRYDAWGRLAETSTQAYADGKPQAAQWTQRLAYRDQRFPDGSQALGQQPVRIDQPSVIAGKTHSTEVDYNDQGQVLRITERGWSPIDAEGKEVPTAIERSTSYRYTTIAGKSLLTEIDGPLPNGPKGSPEDSDVTRVEWDAQGRMPTIARAPGAQQWHWQHDALGYLRRIQLNDGHRQVETEWTWQHSGVAAAQASRMVRRGRLLADNAQALAPPREIVIIEARHDAWGRRIQRTERGEPDTTQSLDYDAWGRPARMTLPDGSQHEWSYDEDGRLLAATLKAPDGAMKDGRAWLRNSTGQILATLGLHGQLRLQSLQLSSDTRDALIEALPPAGQPTSRIRKKDDFGREVMSRDPEDGRIVTLFSADQQEGQVLAVQHQRRIGVDGQGQADEWLYFDAAGRLVRHVSKGTASTDIACEERFRYEGALLSEISGCGESQRFARDALGLITQQDRIRTWPGKKDPILFTERFGYDPQGRLIWRELPDGQLLRYGRAGTQELAVSRLRPWLARLFHSKPNWALAVAAGLPAKWAQEPLVESVHHDLGVQRALLHGNGQRTTWERTSGPAPVASRSKDAPSGGQTPPTAPEPTYDGFGRLAHWVPSHGPFAGERLQLQWTPQHQLQALLRANGELAARYQYDAAGNRTLKQVVWPGKGLQTQQFLYDNHHRLIAIADGEGQVSQQFLYTDHRAHTLLREGKAFSLQTDWRGLPLRMSDNKGEIRWEAESTRFGGQASAEAPPLRLAGQMVDEESGLYYNVHRYLDPKRGRYISPDPLGAADGPDRYAYLNGRPYAGIDPLGLFEIPVKYFFNKSDAYNGVMQVGDGGHGDIVRAAFAIYNGREGNRFSKFFIDEIIKNNYQSDAVDPTHPFPKSGVGGPGIEGGGQFNALNHFDNPHDGPMCKDEACTTLADGYSLDWIKNSLNHVDSNRKKYWDVDPGDGRGDISPLLGAFGQNTHALADFYAHSNWVDGVTRGGRVMNKYKEDGKEKLECGWVPKGKDKRVIWDEDISDSALRTLFSGTVQLGETDIPFLPDYDTTNKVCGTESALGKGDIVCARDKTTHGYWGKDHDETVKDEVKFTASEIAAFNDGRQYYWKVETYSGKPPKTKVAAPPKFETHWYSVDGKAESELKSGDKILVAQPINNRHRLAFSLAVAHTVEEIKRLYDNAAGKMVSGLEMRDVFQMDQKATEDAGIEYENRTKKN